MKAFIEKLIRRSKYWFDFLRGLRLHILSYRRQAELFRTLGQIAGYKLPIFIDKQLRPCLKLQRAPLSCPVFIITIPKSGTYLLAKMFENMGLVNCDVHISGHNIQDNRFASYELLRSEPGRFVVRLPMERTIRLIRPGQFSFGHIPCFRKHQKLLANFKKFFSVREMRDVIISMVRYFGEIRSHVYRQFKDEGKRQLAKEFRQLEMGSEKIKLWFTLWGKQHETLFNNMIPWKDSGDVLLVKFETIMGDEGKDAQFHLIRNIGDFLDLNLSNEQIETVMFNSIGYKTVTYSGKRSDYSEWWSEELEQLFISYGFKAINHLFGYK